VKNIYRTLPEIFWIYNPWWESTALIKEDSKLKELESLKFVYRHPFLEEFPFRKDCILTLRGPRQIGKSTLVKQLVESLIEKKGVSGERIFFYSCDSVADYRELDTILSAYMESARAITKGRLYIFLDEISFVREWQRAVKALADRGALKGCSLLVTGSSSVDILFSAEQMPGRRGRVKSPDVDFMPLSFKEFFALVKGQPASKKKLLDDYLICGGFPAVINEYFSKGYILDETFNTYLSWIEGDLHKLGKSEETAFSILNRFIKHLSSSFSWYKVAKEAGIGSHATVIEYAEILKRMFVVFDVKSLLVSQRLPDPAKNRKVYFFDPFIFNAIQAKVNDYSSQQYSYLAKKVVTVKNKPLLAEGLVASHLKRLPGSLYFGRLVRGEVDFVHRNKGEYRFLEVKYQNDINQARFEAFFKEAPKEKLILVTKNQQFSRRGIKAFSLEDFLLL